VALHIQTVERADKTSRHWERMMDAAWMQGYTAGAKGCSHREVPYIGDDLYGQWFAGYARGEQERGWKG
jgi:ribosome modulation factor